MPRSRCWLGLLCLGLCTPSYAQVIITNGLPVGVPIYVAGGVGIRYGNPQLSINGFIPTGFGYSSYYGNSARFGSPFVPYAPFRTYGSIQNNISIQVISPTSVSRRSRGINEYDVTGVDLDVVSPAKIWGGPEEPRRNPPAERKAEIVPAPRPEKVVEPEKKAPPRVEEKVDPPQAEKKVEQDVWTPRPDPKDEALRFIELGLRAFREESYGLANWRFEQASEQDPKQSQAFFLLGQAHLAIGKYREAMLAIRQGLLLEPNWPNRDYRPRRDLYANHEDTYLQHRQRLEQTLKNQPGDGELMFLLGYLDWYDGRKAEAQGWFRLARPQLADPAPVDLFLKANLAKK